MSVGQRLAGPNRFTATRDSDERDPMPAPPDLIEAATRLLGRLFAPGPSLRIP